ncbi:DUF1877 family protein [Streptomyces sp. NPDC006654]|uniref:DUF1877 family protein n=1 Tax=Streptomyces sp. NPDC006654 TaxID=3156897 RepID=UPI0033D30BFC
MSTYLRLRAVPASAQRNSPTWMEHLFAGNPETNLYRGGRHGEKALTKRCMDQERIYAGALPYGPDVVLGGRSVFRADRHKPPLLVLTAAQARQVAGFLATVDFEALWHAAGDGVLPRHGGVISEPETYGAFAAAHQELRAFYVHTAEYGDAVVKWLSEA